MNFFASNLRYLRKQKGLSQGALSEMIGGKSQNRVSNYEQGRSTPDFDVIDELRKIFSISSDDLLFKDLSQNGHENANPLVAPNTNVDPEVIDKLQREVNRLGKNDKINSPAIKNMRNTAFELRMEMDNLKKEIAALKKRTGKGKEKS